MAHRYRFTVREHRDYPNHVLVAMRDGSIYAVQKSPAIDVMPLDVVDGSSLADLDHLQGLLRCHDA